MAHADRGALVRLAAGELPQAQRERLETHLGDCPQCADMLEQLEATRALLRQGLAAPGPQVDWRRVDEAVQEAEHAIQRVMSDNALGYRASAAFSAVIADLRARHILIRPHCPWQNGKVERLNRTLLREWAYSRAFASNAERAACLPSFIEHYNTRRRHSALGGLPPISRLSTTW